MILNHSTRQSVIIVNGPEFVAALKSLNKTEIK